MVVLGKSFGFFNCLIKKSNFYRFQICFSFIPKITRRGIMAIQQTVSNESNFRSSRNARENVNNVSMHYFLTDFT